MFLLFAVVALSPALAQDEPMPAASAASGREDDPAVITVTADREADLLTNYRAIYAGLLAAQKKTAELAPDARVRFVVTRGRNEPVPPGKKVRVSLVAGNQELLVTDNGTNEFEFPIDQDWLRKSARVVVAGAGANPRLAVHTISPEVFDPVRIRLGNERLYWVFAMAAAKEIATGMKWLAITTLGTRFEPAVSSANPASQRVVVVEKDGREFPLAPWHGRYYYPVNDGKFSNDAVVEVRPLDGP